MCGKPNYEPTFSSDEDQPDTLNTRGGRSRRSAYNPDPGVIYGGGVAKGKPKILEPFRIFLGDRNV